MSRRRKHTIKVIYNKLGVNIINLKKYQNLGQEKLY